MTRTRLLPGLIFFILLLFKITAINFLQIITNNRTLCFPIILDLFLAYNANNTKIIWK
jgi:hypothetical protein